MVQLSYKPSPSLFSHSLSHHSSFLFHSLVLLKIQYHSDQLSVHSSFLSLYGALRPPCVPRSSHVTLAIASSAVIASLIHFFSLSLSLICSESVIYTATSHAEWSRAEQSSEGSLTFQSGHHLRNTTKLFSLSLYPCLHRSVSSSHENVAVHTVLCTKY